MPRVKTSQSKGRKTMTTTSAKDEIKKYIKANHGCVLSTIVNGVPRATPVNYFSDGRTIYVYSEGGRKFDYLLKNKTVSLGICHTKPLFGAQVFGTAEIFKQNNPRFMNEVKKSGFMRDREFVGEKPPYFLSLIKITPEKIVYWSTRKRRSYKTLWDLTSPKGTGSVVHDRLEFIDGLAVKHVYPEVRKKRIPLLFLPDAFQGSWAYTNFQYYFATKGWESYALNFRGHFVGQYARIDGFPVGRITGSEHIDNFIEDFEKTIAICKNTPYVVATGIGALIALKYAERSRIKKMVLFNPAPTSELFDSIPLNRKKVKENLKRYIRFSKSGTCIPKKHAAKEWQFHQIEPEMQIEFESLAFLNEEPSDLFLKALTGGISVKLSTNRPSLLIIGSRNNLWTGESVNKMLSNLLRAKKFIRTDKSCQSISLMPDWKRYATIVESWL
jgi:pimeloyl-ACP methyl ester carboxylesterase